MHLMLELALQMKPCLAQIPSSHLQSDKIQDCQNFLRDMQGRRAGEVVSVRRACGVQIGLAMISNTPSTRSHHLRGMLWTMQQSAATSEGRIMDQVHQGHQFSVKQLQAAFHLDQSPGRDLGSINMWRGRILGELLHSHLQDISILRGENSIH